MLLFEALYMATAYSCMYIVATKPKTAKLSHEHDKFGPMARPTLHHTISHEKISVEMRCVGRALR